MQTTAGQYLKFYLGWGFSSLRGRPHFLWKVYNVEVFIGIYFVGHSVIVLGKFSRHMNDHKYLKRTSERRILRLSEEN